MYTVEDIVAKACAYLPATAEPEIRKAYEYAARMHDGQQRLSGLPYIQHPLAVADLVATLRLDTTSICAALLHDVREDAFENTSNLEEVFGPEIAGVVEGVTNLQKFQFTSRQEKQAENFKKMLVAMSADIRVLLVKLCDRLNNMRELEFHNPEKQREISEETLQIYSPLAERLGIAWIRTELEDLCFRFLWPEEFAHLKAAAEARLKERAGFIREVIDQITTTLHEGHVQSFEVTGRPKNLFGIFRKMRAQGIDLEHVYDFVAFRVLVREVVDCWMVLGFVHNLWRPIPARFKDYINVAKPNGYRSLHTTVFGPQGEPMEIQIRTWDMHRVAEAGIAAHWKYKEGGTVHMRDEERFNWLRQLIDWAQELRSPGQFMETVHESLFTDQIFVFTPKGDLRVLPRDATVVDFAYDIHTEVGHACVGGRVNNRLVPLSTPLRSGDLVEIMTTRLRRPKRDWLNFVITARAHNKIRSFFQAEEKAHAIEIGRQVLEKELRRQNLPVRKVLEEGPDRARLLEALHVATLDDLLRAVGIGKVTGRDIAEVLNPGAAEVVTPEAPIVEERPLKRQGRGSGGIAVDGVEDMLLHLGRCCNPIPGDEIVAFITRGRGVTIHVRSCLSLRGTDTDRLLQAHWVKLDGGLYEVPMDVRCVDEPGVLARVTKEISDRKANISSITTQALGEQQTQLHIVLQVQDQQQFNAIARAIHRTRGVIRVSRLRQTADAATRPRQGRGQ